MATLHCGYLEDFNNDIKTLQERNIPYKTRDTSITVDDKYKVVLCEFRLRYHMQSPNVIGVQIFGNDDKYFGHTKDEVIKCPRKAAELLAEAKIQQPDYPWHDKMVYVDNKF